MHEFKINELVYFDSFCGLVKGKIVDITWDDTMALTPNSQKFTIKVTALKHRIYKLGELIESSRLHTIPRDKIYTRSGIYHIRPY